MRVLCPYCCNDVPAGLLRESSRGRHINCVRREANGKANYSHELVNTGTPPDEQHELIHKLYLESAMEGNSRIVAIVGSAAAGKTVWLNTLDFSINYPSPGNNYLWPFLKVFSLTTAARNQDVRERHVRNMARGILPRPTPVYGATVSLPFSIGRSRRGSQARKPGLLGRLMQNPPPNRLSISLRDVGGESAREMPVAELLGDIEKRHLEVAPYYLFMIDAQSNESIVTSSSVAIQFLNTLQNITPFERKAIVAYSRIDERITMERSCDDPVLKAAATTPNQFRGVPLDIKGKTKDDIEKYIEDYPKDYLRGMDRVQDAVKADLESREGGLAESLEDLFGKDNIRFCALTSLGSKPVAPPGATATDTDQFRCICAPIMIRIWDPILWIMNDAGLI